MGATKRNKTRQITVGCVPIGGGAPITVQSMTNTKTADITATAEQISRLQEAGCDIVRVAVPDKAAAMAISGIKARIKIPLVADIHFDYRLALYSMENGADKIRINPGNIGEDERVKQVADKARAYKIPIRVGVNSGSLEPEILKKYKKPCPQAMVESALYHIELLARYDFHDVAVSLKSSDVTATIEAYRLFSKKANNPLHVGVTEAGTIWAGNIKSSAGIGAILSLGIGDTIRVSLTGDPAEEIKTGIQILKALGLRKGGAQLISCPTCGRCNVDLIGLANSVEAAIMNIHKPIKVAVMGCAVNGPGEAKEADIGVACGINEGLIIKKGKVLRKVAEEDIVKVLLEEIESL